MMLKDDWVYHSGSPWSESMFPNRLLPGKVAYHTQACTGLHLSSIHLNSRTQTHKNI